MKHSLYAAATILALGGLAPTAHAANADVEAALAGKDNLSMFYQVFLASGVANELRPDMPYTVFAPTNAAFVASMPRAYLCYATMPCRTNLAALVRNHIVPGNERVSMLVKEDPVATLGTRRLDVDEPYQGSFTVNDNRVLNQIDGAAIKIYRIDGVITDANELAQINAPQQLAILPTTVVEKTTTIYAPAVSPYATVTTPYTTTTTATVPALPTTVTYVPPGTTTTVYSEVPTIVTPVGSDAPIQQVVVQPGEISDQATQTTTVTHTTTSQTVR